ncbi:MAG: tetratricopeptide repeat protein [Xenococcus sp. (in: cyanobacteria)]
MQLNSIENSRNNEVLNHSSDVPIVEVDDRHILSLTRQDSISSSSSEKSANSATEIDINPTAQAMINQGHKLWQEGKLDEAISAFKEAAESDANSYKAHHFIGCICTKQSKLEAAVEAYQKALEINPDYDWSYHGLGQVLFWQGKVDEAIAAARRAIEIESTGAPFYNLLGQCLESQGRTESAIAAYREALKIKPDLTIASEALENLVKNQNEVSYEKLQNVYIPNQVVEVTQNEDIASKRKDIEREITTYRKSIRLASEPDFAAHHNLYGKLANNLQRLGELFLDEALHYYNLAINNDSNNLDNYYKSLKLNPDQPTLYCDLANILRKQGKTGADVFYQMALQLDPKNAQAYLGLADLYLRDQRKQQKGIELLVQANRLNTDLVESYLCQLLVKI